MLRLGLPNSGYQTASRLQRPLICSRPRQQHNCYSAAHLHRPASYAQLQATAAAMRKAKGPQGSGVVKALAGDGCGSVGSGSGGGSRGGCGGGGAGMGGAGMGGAGSPDDDNVSRLLSSMQECAGLGLTVTALSDPESFKESVQRVPDAKAQLQVIMQDWISQHPDGAVGVLFDASGLMFCGDPIIKMASLVGGMERTFAVPIGEDTHTPYKAKARMESPSKAQETKKAQKHFETLCAALDSDNPAAAMSGIIADDFRRRTMREIAAKATSRPGMTGLWDGIPDAGGVPVIPYFTGCGYQADDLLGGAVEHATAMARRHLGIHGPLLFVTMACDDDWLGAAAASKKSKRQTVDKISPKRPQRLKYYGTQIDGMYAHLKQTGQAAPSKQPQAVATSRAAAPSPAAASQQPAPAAAQL